MVLAIGGFKTLMGHNGPNPKNMLYTALPGSPDIMVYKDYYSGHYKKNGHPFNDAMEIQTPRSI
jgi:hypothetical protein